MDDYKQKTWEAYERYAGVFDHKYKKHFYSYVLAEAENFVRHLYGNKVIDLGSGPGDHALYFQEKGLDVLCVDFSKEMLQLCNKKD